MSQNNLACQRGWGAEGGVEGKKAFKGFEGKDEGFEAPFEAFEGFETPFTFELKEGFRPSVETSPFDHLSKLRSFEGFEDHKLSSETWPFEAKTAQNA